MEWTERHHAFLIGLFYRETVRQWGKEGEAIFIEAVKEYAEQRGRRMAMRARNHGFAPDFFAYFSHGEWAPSETPILKGQSFADGTDWVILNPECPWLSTFQAMEEPACARVYCSLIDKHLLKGFNPSLCLEVETFLQDTDFCTFRWKQADLKERDWLGIAEIKKRYKKENVCPFEYHTGHVWKTFKEVIEKKKEVDSMRVLDRVLEEFRFVYGKESVNEILTYQSMDFNKLPAENKERKCYEIVNCPMNGTAPKTAKCQVYREQTSCWTYDWKTLYHQMPEGKEKQQWRIHMLKHCPRCPSYHCHEADMKTKLKELNEEAEGSNEE